MIVWHQRLSAHEPEQILGDGEGQGGLACCRPWGHKELDSVTEQQQELYTSMFSFIAKEKEINYFGRHTVAGLGTRAKKNHSLLWLTSRPRSCFLNAITD